MSPKWSTAHPVDTGVELTVDFAIELDVCGGGGGDDNSPDQRSNTEQAASTGGGDGGADADGARPRARRVPSGALFCRAGRSLCRAVGRSCGARGGTGRAADLRGKPRRRSVGQSVLTIPFGASISGYA